MTTLSIPPKKNTVILQPTKTGTTHEGFLVGSDHIHGNLRCDGFRFHVGF